MTQKKFLVFVNTASLLLMLAANFVSGLPSNNRATVGEVSHRFDTLFAPADYAFIIWAAIFAGLMAFVIYQWILLNRNDPKDYITKTGIWLLVSNTANALWIYFWTREMIGLSVLLIIILLCSLIMLSIRLRLELDDEPVQSIVFVWWPLVIYLGWIIAAVIANIAAWLVSEGWHGGSLGEDGWTVLMLAAGTLIYLLLIWKRNMREAAAAGAWAFVAIAVKQWQEHNTVAIVAAAASALLLIAILIHGFHNRFYSIAAKAARSEWK